MAVEGNLLTPRQVAERLQFTTARPIYRMIREGEFPAAKIGGRLLIDAEDVRAMVERARPKPKRLTGGLRELERSVSDDRNAARR